MNVLPHPVDEESITVRASIMLFVLTAGLCLAAGCTGPFGLTKNTEQLIGSTLTPSIVPAESVNVTEVAPQVACPLLPANEYHITKGDPFEFTGQVPYQNISAVRLWMFGRNTSDVVNLSVDGNGSFNYTLSGWETKHFVAGTKRFIVQYPEKGDRFEINPLPGDSLEGVFDIEGHLLFRMKSIHENKIDGLEAEATLEREIQKSGTDRSTNATLVVEDPWIHIDPVSNHTAGDKFILTGTTNLAAGDQVIFDVIGRRQTEREQEWNENHGWAQVTTITQGPCRNNSLSFAVDTSTYELNEINVIASAVQQDAVGTGRFFII
jgi:hypothetical protein